MCQRSNTDELRKTLKDVNDLIRTLLNYVQQHLTGSYCPVRWRCIWLAGAQCHHIAHFDQDQRRF
jgi:hypothetical protein